MKQHRSTRIRRLSTYSRFAACIAAVAVACAEPPVAPSLLSSSDAVVRFSVESENSEVNAMGDTVRALSDSMTAEAPAGWGGGGVCDPSCPEPMSGNPGRPLRTSTAASTTTTDEGPFTCKQIYDKFYAEKQRFDDAWDEYWNRTINGDWLSPVREDARLEMRDAHSAMKMWRNYWNADTQCKTQSGGAT